MIALLQDPSGPAEAVKSAAEGRLPLFGAYSLADPWFLALIPVVLLVVWHGRSRRGREPGRVPALPSNVAALTLPRTLKQRLLWIPPTLSGLALVFVIAALTRPLLGDVTTSSVSEGVDIALIIDRSSSMQAEDLAPNKSRLAVVKDVVSEFAARRMTDEVSAADNVALVTFSRYPQLLCPFTLDVDAIQGFLDQVEIVRFRAEDGTGIGIALAKAVAVLRETQAKSKVCVLLTDGQNNLDEISPMEAATLAAEAGIRVHTVFAGRFEFQQDVFGNVRATDIRLDTTELEGIAKKTGGRFFRALDREGLEEAYRTIEELERTPREEKRFSESFDLYSRFLFPALAFYLLSWILGSTWLRRLT